MFTQPMALRSVLDPKYLEYCLSDHYSIGRWKECVYWLRGLNDTYRVQTDKGYFILRVYRTEIGEQDVSYELALLGELTLILSETATQVSQPIAKKDQSFYTAIDAPEGTRLAVIFRYLYGTEETLLDTKSCFAFGKSAAELHAAMNQVTIDIPRHDLDLDFLIERPLNRILNHVGKNREARDFLKQFATGLRTRIESVAATGLDWGVCHGDMHGNNNAFLNGDHFTHYDFEWAAKGWRAYDLAQVKARKRQPDAGLKAKTWNALMDGYRSVRVFSQYDEEAIDLFVIARRFWVMGLDVAFVYDTGILDFTENWLNGFIEEFSKTELV